LSNEFGTSKQNYEVQPAKMSILLVCETVIQFPVDFCQRLSKCFYLSNKIADLIEKCPLEKVEFNPSAKKVQSAKYTGN